MTTRNGRSWLISLVWLVGAFSPAYGADTEQREFSILVDGKEAGSSTLTIVTQDDGSSYMKAKVQVKFQQVVFPYQLSLETEEWWKDGKLVGAKTQSVENGKKTDLVASGEAKGIRVRVNGQDSMVKADAWTSSYWKLDPRHNQKITILETDSGKELNGSLEFAGHKLLTLNNQPTKCYHFKVTGVPQPIELWYDIYHRLVRQEFVENGHKTIVSLVAVRR